MQTSRRLVFFHSELDTLNLFSDQLKQEFENLGYETFEFDLAQSALSLGLLYGFYTGRWCNRNDWLQHAFFRHAASLG